MKFFNSEVYSIFTAYAFGGNWFTTAYIQSQSNVLLVIRIRIWNHITALSCMLCIRCK